MSQKLEICVTVERCLISPLSSVEFYLASRVLGGINSSVVDTESICSFSISFSWGVCLFPINYKDTVEPYWQHWKLIVSYTCHSLLRKEK